MKNLVLVVLALSLLLVMTSCGEKAAPAIPVAIPSVTVNCTTLKCKANTTPYVYVYITQFACDPSYANLAVASSSLRLNCTASGGCYGSPSSWVNGSNSVITTVTAGTYTVCGRIDYNGNYTSGIYGDDTTGSQNSVAISESISPVTITGWIDL